MTRSFLHNAWPAILLAASLAGQAPAAAPAPAVKIAVLDFRTVGDSAELGDGAAEILRTALTGLGGYTVLERGMLGEALKEQKYALSGVVDAATAAGIGKILGAQVVVVGSVVRLGDTYTLNIRLVDVQTGAVLAGKTLTAQARDDIPRLCRLMARLLAGKDDGFEERLMRRDFGPKKGHLAVGGIYPGVSLKYLTAGNTAWELKGQAGSGITAAGARWYRYGSVEGGARLFIGLEADYLSFKGKVSAGKGYAGGAFVGSELFLGDQVSLSADFGPMYLRIEDGAYSLAAGGVEYIANFGVYWHFR